MKRENTIKVRSGRKGVLRPGHPWIFKTQILKTAPAIKPGDIISVVDDNNRFIGRGYYNPKSEIVIRLFTFSDEPIDRDFFYKRLSEAVGKRKALLAATNACRIVFSEADGLPGLIVDLYNNTAVFQVLTFGMEKFKSEITDIIDDILKPRYIYEKSASPFRKLEGLKDVIGWWGDEGKGIVEISEGKARFLVDIVNGHKTGFYLDQRKSRLALESISKDKRVLDLFCYTGGFSISAALYGAGRVVGRDIKEEWLKLARENSALNNVSGKTEFAKGDAFTVLKEINDSGEKFDIIILDPPSFLKTRESLIMATKGYKELNGLALNALVDGGVLATFSCSHNMPGALFSKIIKESAAGAGKRSTILKRCHQAEDHPIVKAIPETEYLKGYFLKVFETTNQGS
ncbi:MAG: class I SAM-dependent rRNA methyltransferase [Candidatus Omnitrophica bacterium]|nr:class I SAM-dependent rRNA methyltransferase [Candidatus Omnitrophota bacterium]MDD5436765.1 class I SAM-dependent rRNA methyltransferase [Candidatus Omnitrophota bacterium]